MNQACILCGSKRGREIFRLFKPRAEKATGRHTEDLFGRAGRIVRCTGCGLVRQEHPLEAPYDEADEDLEYLAEEKGIRHTFRNTLDMIERYRQPPGTILDVGCGPGFLLEEARKRGWHAVGIEPSRWAAAEAHRRGHVVEQSSLDQADLPINHFDAILANDVIEHVPNPLVFAERIHELLAPGGIAFIATPNVESLAARLLRRWWWSVIPNHLWFLSPRTLSAILRTARLEPAEVRTHPKTFSLDYYAGRFAGYSDTLGRVLKLAARRLGGNNRLVTPDFRDRIAMIAMKS